MSHDLAIRAVLILFEYIQIHKYIFMLIAVNFISAIYYIYRVNCQYEIDSYIMSEIEKVVDDERDEILTELT